MDQPSGLAAAGDVVVDLADGISMDNSVLKIEGEDGSVLISLDGTPLSSKEKKTGDWFANLANEIDPSELSRISDDLIRGVEDDLLSRNDWIEDRANGIKLLGLRIEIPNTSGVSEGAPVEGMSQVRHPLLQEAVLRFQANARSELLPTDGPVKVRNDDNNANLVEDQVADALEKDLNHYLTVTASEYYPDTDRMLLLLGFGGTTFKKVYYCPLRNRPVSETVAADDVIVNNSATDLRNAMRVTHRVMMKPSTLKRLQIIGAYRDVPLQTPNPQNKDAVQREKDAQQGISAKSSRPEDLEHEIYEVYCELDIKDFEHRIDGEPSGLPIPYVVTIEVSSREILSIVRNYDEETKELPEAKTRFVKYTFVPGLGFYDIGLLNILGNTTNAVTAAWRELLDAGMFSNFPGFLYAKDAGRQNTNVFRVPPGGGAPIETGGRPIGNAVMQLPYKEPSQALMALVTNIAETGMRVGGTAEQAVGEGRQDAPVGTTLALIEQATKILNSVHKRMHAAQAEEFRLLVECFREHPESFWQRNKNPAYPWDEQTFLTAINNCELTPQADPNTASHTQRVMKIMALKQLQAGSPQLYDPVAVDTAALQALGWPNPQQFFKSPEQQSQPTPEILKGMADVQNDTKKADADLLAAQAKMVDAKAKAQAPQGLAAAPNPLEQQNLNLKVAQLHSQNQRAAIDDHNRDLDRAADLKIAEIRALTEAAKLKAQHEHENGMQVTELLSDHLKEAQKPDE